MPLLKEVFGMQEQPVAAPQQNTRMSPADVQEAIAVLNDIYGTLKQQDPQSAGVITKLITHLKSM